MSVYMPGARQSRLPRGPAFSARRCECQCRGAQHADPAGGGDNQRRGGVLRRGAGDDDRDALAEADAALGDAEGLAALAGRSGLDERGIRRDLVAGEHAGNGQEYQHDGQAGVGCERDKGGGGGDGQRPGPSGSLGRADETAEAQDAGRRAECLGRQDQADRDRATASDCGQRCGDAFGKTVERAQPAEQHGRTKGRAAEDQPQTHHNPRERARFPVPAAPGSSCGGLPLRCGGRRGHGHRPGAHPGPDDQR
jgi:hypothetical protein